MLLHHTDAARSRQRIPSHTSATRPDPGLPPWLTAPEAQPEARVLHAVLTEPYRLAPGETLGQLRPDAFTARPEYGPILTVARHLYREHGPQRFDRDRFADAATAAGYNDTLADVAARVVRYAPWDGPPGRLAAFLTDRADRLAHVIAEMDALGITAEGVAVPTEPPVEAPPEPLTSTFTADEVVVLEDPLEVGLHDIDALAACEHVARVAVRRGDRITTVPVPCGLRTCAGCGTAILDRITAPIAAAGPVYVASVDEDDRKTLGQRVRRAGADAKWFPRADGQVLVVSTHPVGPVVDPDELPDLLADAFASVPDGRRITTTGDAWTHAAAPTMPAGDGAEILGYVRVSHLAERRHGERITGQPVEEIDADEHLPAAKRRRTYLAADQAIVERLCAAWRVLTPAEARTLAAEARALRDLDEATRRIVARHREAA